MLRPVIFARLLLTLALTGILLPITLCVILGVAALLTQMGDTVGGAVLCRIALGGGILWAVDLIWLLLLLAVGSLSCPNESDQSPD